MLEKLNCFAEEKGPDALKEIFQSYGVSRFSELPEDKWFEVLKLMGQQETEDDSLLMISKKRAIDRIGNSLSSRWKPNLSVINSNWESSCNCLRHGG